MTAIAYNAAGTPTDMGGLTLSATSLPLGTVKVVCTAALTDGNTAGSCNAEAQDLCGTFAATADPETSLLKIAGGGETVLIFTNIQAAERFVGVLNGTPGLTKVTVVVNGSSYVLAPLSDGGSKSLDVSAAMNPGDANTVVVIGEGAEGASAAVSIGDSPPGDPMITVQPVALQIQSSAGGVQLSWPGQPAGWVLQSRSSMAASEAWVNWPDAPESVNGRSVQTVPASGRALFFRLYKP